MRIMVTVVAALIGAAAFEWLRVPAGALVGAMVAVAAVNVGSSVGAAHLPSVMQFLAFAAIGWFIGQGVTADLIRSLASRWPLLLGTVAMLIALGGLLAVALVQFQVLDPATAFLATSPGALSQMSALSAAVGANASIVVTVHVTRVIAVVLVAPLVIKLLPADP